MFATVEVFLYKISTAIADDSFKVFIPEKVF